MAGREPDRCSCDRLPFCVRGDARGDDLAGSLQEVHRFAFVDIAPGHPLGNLGLRNFPMQGYVFVSSVGCACIYWVFLMFLGTEFVTGIGREYNPHSSSWLLAGPYSLNVTNVTNRSGQTGI